MRQITGLIWHDKSCLATQGLSLWAGAKGSLLLLPPRTVTHKLQRDSCAIFFHIAMHWCRGIPDTVSCPFQQGHHHISYLRSSVGRVGGNGISFHYHWEEKWSDPLSCGTHLVSKKPNAQKGLCLTSSQEQEYNYHKLCHLLLKLYFNPLCHECSPTVPTVTLPKLSFATFSHWAWKGGLAVVLPDLSLLIQNPNITPKDITAGPTSYPLQGTLGIAICSRALHLLMYAHPIT